MRGSLPKPQLLTQSVKPVLNRLKMQASDVVSSPCLAAYCALYRHGEGPSAPSALLGRFLANVLTIRVDPQAITKKVPANKNGETFAILGGDWDLVAKPVESSPAYVSRIEIFRELDVIQRRGRHFKESAVYRRYLTMLHSGERIQHLKTIKTPSELDAYFQRCMKLLDDMRRRGYRSQRELMNGRNELGVAIGRAGEIIRFGDGNHRFVVARMLRQRHIVAAVRRVHPIWLNTQCAAQQTSPPASLRGGLTALEAKQLASARVAGNHRRRSGALTPAAAIAVGSEWSINAIMLCMGCPVVH